MKYGKVRLRRILSKVENIPIRDIMDHGEYEDLGYKERLTVGSHTIIAKSDGISIMRPVFKDDRVLYETIVLGDLKGAV